MLASTFPVEKQHCVAPTIVIQCSIFLNTTYAHADVVNYKLLYVLFCVCIQLAKCWTLYGQ